MRVSEGDYSGAVRVFARANKRLDAIERAAEYEQQGHQLDADVNLLQLASHYAKYYAQRKDDHHLRKVIKHVPSAVMKGAYLKQAGLHEEALDVYIKANLVTEAKQLTSAQELYETGISWAQKEGNKVLEAMFVTEKVAALVYHKKSVGSELKEALQHLTKSGSASTKALACLLFGRVFDNPGMCRQSMETYQGAAVNTVGELEAFNQLVRLKKDQYLHLIVSRCILASDLANAFKHPPKSAFHAQLLQQAQEFYHLRSQEGVYLMPRAQDVWLPNGLHSANCRDRLVDEDGMVRLQPEKVHRMLADHFSSLWKAWLAVTDVVGKIQQRIAGYSFHQELMTNGYLTHSNQSYPAERLKSYLQLIDLVLLTKQLSPTAFGDNMFEALPLKLLSPRVALCLPLGKQHRTLLTNSSAICRFLRSFAGDSLKQLKNERVDDLFSAWRALCIAEGGTGRMEESLERFASRHGHLKPEETGFSLVSRKEKDAQVYHHYFWFWLRACSIISEERIVLPAVKCAYHFLQVIARRRQLRETMSVANFVNVISLCTTALVGLLNLVNPTQHLLLPALYQHTVQLFDLLNAPGPKDTWLMSTCVEQVNRKRRAKQLDRMEQDAVEYLFKFLDLLTGQSHERCHILQDALSPTSGCIADGSALHCLMLCLVLVSNLLVIKMEHFKTLANSLADICNQLRRCLSSDNPPTTSANTSSSTPLPQYLLNAYIEISSADCIAKLFMAVQHLMGACQFQSNLCRLVPKGSTGGMDFMEMPIPPLLFRRNFEALAPLLEPLPQQLRQMPPHPLAAIVQDQYLPPHPLKAAMQNQQLMQQEPQQPNQYPFSSNLSFQQPSQLAYPNQVHPFPAPFLDPTVVSPFAYSQPGISQPVVGIPQEWEDELAGIEFDEEVEQMLSQSVARSEVERPLSEVEVSSSSLSSEDSALIDEHYCRVCGVGLEPLGRETIAVEEGEEGEQQNSHASAKASKQQTFQEHILTPTHQQNLQAFKLFNQQKMMHYDPMVERLSELLREAEIRVNTVDVEMMMAQCKSELLSAEQHLMDIRKQQQWKEGQTFIEFTIEKFRWHLNRLENDACKQQRQTSTNLSSQVWELASLREGLEDEEGREEEEEAVELETDLGDGVDADAEKRKERQRKKQRKEKRKP